MRYYREFPDPALKEMMLRAVDDLIENGNNAAFRCGAVIGGQRNHALGKNLTAAISDDHRILHMLVDDLIENCYVEKWGVFYYKELPSLNWPVYNTLLLGSHFLSRVST